MSDWSSDVCASDLDRAGILPWIGQRRQQFLDLDLFVAQLVGIEVVIGRAVHLARRTTPVQRERQRDPAGLRAQFFLADVVRPAAAGLADAAAHDQHVDRSEEHTSELQSLMRISYAVFCLNKKKN